MAYKIIVKPSAQKDLDKLPDKELKRIASRLEQLRNNPRSIGVQKLSDDEGYRLRGGFAKPIKIGNIIFEYSENQLFSK